MLKSLVALLLSFFLFISGYSQVPVSWTSSDMYLALRKLNILGSVLYMAAHPDDENTRLLAYLAKDKMVRTGYLSLTRGDGGQNLIGDEQGVELGLIRTQELLSARRIDGAEQFFTRAYDFGFSKSPEETFTKWDKEKILADVVWVIRKFQPDVIISRFPTTGEGGHGHHTASAILANEAFTAAADPHRFPEQLSAPGVLWTGSGGRYVQPWQAKRILWNTFNFGGTNTIRDDQLKIDVGGFNPLLGKSYGEIAAQSRSQHKSQGFGVPASRGESLEYFKATNGTQPVTDLLEDVDISWTKIKGGEIISRIIDSLSSAFDLLHPEKSVKGLIRLYRALNAMPDNYWKIQKLNETLQLMEACSGLWIDITTNEQFAVQTDSIRMNFSLNNRLGVDVKLKRVVVDDFDSTFLQNLDKNKNVNFSKTFYVAASRQVTQPYWLENKMEEGYFNVSDQQLIGVPNVLPSYVAKIYMEIEGQPLVYAKPVKYKFTDPVKGELYEPLVVLPYLTTSIKPEINIITENTKDYQYQIDWEAHTGIRGMRIYNKGKNITYDDTTGRRKGQNGSAFINLNLEKKENNQYKRTSDNEYTLESTPKPAQSLHTIKYDHIPYITYFKNAKNKDVFVDLKTFGKKIGYIVGAGDKVPEALEQMGYEVTLLTDKELSRNHLKQFDAIISGVRAYNTNEWMNKYYEKLMKYVNDGGNYIVQYNTNNFISNVRSKIGPYNFNISRNRVSDENAPVSFTKPEHPALNYPNKITEDDFKGWMQERSIYHASEWDKNFETIISMNDPGEKPDEGSLIIAKYGKGTFVYTGVVFFRELPAGVPGAYRLMANLIALNRKKEAHPNLLQRGRPSLKINR